MVDVRGLPVGEGVEEIAPALDELAREGARRMIAAALRAEADEYVERFSDDRDGDGYRLVVCNGRARERRVTVGSGTIPVRAPRVNDQRARGAERGAAAVLLADPAGVRKALFEGWGGDPDPVPPRPVDGRLPPSARRAAWRGHGRACRQRRSAGWARSGKRTTPGSESGCCPLTGTPTCSWTGSTSGSGSVRTRRCAC